MSEAVETPGEETTTPATPDGTTPDGSEGKAHDLPYPKGSKEALLADLSSERDKRKSLQQKLEDAESEASKRVAELEAQLAQVGSANETALQEAQEVAKKAQEDLAQATLNASRYKVAGRFGISTEVAEGEEKSQAEMLLTGATEDEMINQAKIISSLRQSAQDDALVDPTQGGGAGGGRQKVEYEPGAPRMAAAFDAQIQK